MTEIAILANGCFWCTEAIFKKIKGVVSVVPGYIGGDIPNPTYEQVCTGKTNHAEAVQITFEANVITYAKLLDVFWHTHNPTTLNKQGADVGTQYRSAIFYTSEEQKAIAEKSKLDLDLSGTYSDPVVTEITKATIFYPAENYHHDYFNNNPTAGYCQLVIQPKLEDFWKRYKELI